LNKSKIIIDACALINFYASGKFDSILQKQPAQAYIVEEVKSESLFIKNFAKSGEYQPILLDHFLNTGLIKLVKLKTSAEKHLFVNLACQIDDGEAATLAIASSRKMQIITDDRKAIRVLKQEVPKVKQCSSLAIIKHWCESQSVSKKEIKKALKNIHECARYQPHHGHQLYDWWRIHIS